MDKITIYEEDLKFQLPEDNRFPQIIFNEMCPQEIGEMLSKNFVALQENGLKVNRLMTEDEITEVRAVYGDIAEQQIPKISAELEMITSAFKAQKERLTAELTALNNEFTDLVSVAREGVRDFTPEPENTYKIPVAGHYLYYTYTGTKFQLISVREIPSDERYDLFNTGEKNKEMLEQMGYEIPDFSAENKENYRVVKCENGEWVEIWEEDGKEKILRHYLQDVLDDDIGELISVELTETEYYPLGENPYENEQIEAQDGQAYEVPVESEG